MTLTDLVDASGIPARTIRFYIARGLLDGPVKAGRGAEYTNDHLDRLERIKDLQSSGRALSEIGRVLGGEREPAIPQPTSWWNYNVADDVVVFTRTDMPPWRIKQVRAAIEDFARSVRPSSNPAPRGSTDGKRSNT